MFDRYVSLGTDSEVGFQLKRVHGAQETGFFSWNITNPPALVSLLASDFSNIIQSDDLNLHGVGTLISDSSHGFLIHHEFDLQLFKDAPDYAEKLKKLQEKFAYLAKLFREQASAPGRTAYFYKCTANDAKALALTVLILLRRYHGQNPYDLIILQAADRAEPDWGLPGIHNRYVKRFAPYDDTPDAHVMSWDAVFREFPHKEPLKLANY